MNEIMLLAPIYLQNKCLSLSRPKNFWTQQNELKNEFFYFNHEIFYGKSHKCGRMSKKKYIKMKRKVRQMKAGRKGGCQLYLLFYDFIIETDFWNLKVHRYSTLFWIPIRLAVKKQAVWSIESTELGLFISEYPWVLFSLLMLLLWAVSLFEQLWLRTFPSDFEFRWSSHWVNFHGLAC